LIFSIDPTEYISGEVKGKEKKDIAEKDAKDYGAKQEYYAEKTVYVVFE